MNNDDGILENKKTLAQAIQKSIGNRIVLSLSVSCFMLLAFIGYSLSSELDVLQMRIGQEVKPLEDFIITQTMINNKQAIQLRLSELNTSSEKAFKQIRWIPVGKPSNNKLDWQFPLTWTYEYPLGEVIGYQFGYFQVTGSLLQDESLVNNLVAMVIFLIVFSLLLFLLLYPLSQRIPKKLFIDPINHFLNLLSSDEKVLDNQRCLPSELQVLEKKIVLLMEQIKEHEQQKALIRIGQIAAQVAHDIRSPLTALNTALKYLTNTPDEQRILLRNVSNRINGIANHLLEEYTQKDLSKNEKSLCLLASLVDNILSEKRLQFDGQAILLDVLIDESGSMAFVLCHLQEMKRLLSNILNNAAEALTEQNRSIYLSLSVEKEWVDLTIQDAGVGIPQDKLKTLWKKGSSSKKNGAGLGLPHAKETVESWGGKITLHSKINEGTKVSIKLPHVPTPHYFTSEIVIYLGDFIVIVDDDLSVHDAWKQRFQSQLEMITLVHFYQPEAFAQWYEEQPKDSQRNCVVLSDYECMGEISTGLDIFERLKLRGVRSILVTSHYEDQKIVDRCKLNGNYLLPKNCLASIPIVLKTRKTADALYMPDFIIIDDDTNLLTILKEGAIRNGRNGLFFAHPDEFKSVADKLDKQVPIYIDSQFKLPSGEVLKGEIWAKSLFEQGFFELYLASGYPAWHFGPPMPWFKAILPKEFLLSVIK